MNGEYEVGRARYDPPLLRASRGEGEKGGIGDPMTSCINKNTCALGGDIIIS